MSTATISRLDDAGTPRSDASVLVSVLIPLEDHRHHAERSIRAWCNEQTFDRDRYEVIAVASPSLSRAQLARIRALMAPHDRVVTAPPRHDVAQLVDAAARARGEFLFVSESHAWPLPDVLQRCVDTLRARPDWQGLVCGIRRVTLNRLGEVEADMYERDFRTGSTGLRWRNINDVAFFTRRAAYDAAGGFDAALGHFAEWVLAARYATEGFAVGHCPDIELRHLYTGHLGTLRHFTEDFVRGEITYLARDPVLRRETLIEAPAEWSSRGDRRPGLARAVLRLFAAERARARAQRCSPAVSRPEFRWVAAALVGGAAAQAGAALRVAACRVRLFVAYRLASMPVLAAAFDAYIAAVIRRARLRWSAEFLRRPASQTGELWSAFPEFGDAGAGFHDCESLDGVAFRWSQPVAAVSLDLPPGRYCIHVHTLCAQFSDRSFEPRFYVDGQPVTGVHAAPHGNAFTFDVTVRGGDGTSWLGWTCAPTWAPHDRRRFGLPLVSVLATLADP